MKEPIISIVMPVYNNEKYLGNAIESILNQQLDYKDDIQLIVVDDGSTDGTGTIADSFANRDSRVKVVHQKNQWIYASINNGVRVAEGKYIFIVNSDDVLVKDSLNAVINKVKYYDFPDIVWMQIQIYRVDENQNITSLYCTVPEVETDEYVGEEDDVHTAYIKAEKLGLTGNQANLYKRELYLNHPCRNDVFFADNFFNYQIAIDVRKMAFISDIIYEHYIYDCSDRNASKGKFYPNVHDKYNELYFLKKRTFSEWSIPKDEWAGIIIKDRLKKMRNEVLSLSYSNCDMSLDQKVEEILKNIADRTIRCEAASVGMEREYESRILNGMAYVVNESNDRIGPKYAFVKNLISFLPKDYRDNVVLSESQLEKIKEAIYCENNIDNVGKVYYTTKWDEEYFTSL